MKQMIYATLYIGRGAAGSQDIFTVPHGQRMPAMLGPEQRCPTCGHWEESPVQTVEHTNISTSGHFGAAVGDVELTSIEVKTSDGREQRSSIGLASWEIGVGGRRIAGGRVAELLTGPVPLPKIRVDRNDTFIVRIGIPPGTTWKRYSPPAQEDKEPLLVKVEFWANVLDKETP